ncbi:hypothetical protein AWB78_01241 [Caballeronia calidae]|uniref:Uncharacterized protein n=1 Tax=Caballeronia calidae TaxID=1777139 RepID=A0A158A470_9BURK|nr:hypothetical protein AWB78_01241 [Caballeronia calidae]
MNVVYLWLELVALAVLAWLCRDKIKPVIGGLLDRKACAHGAVKPRSMLRSHRPHAPLPPRRLRRNRSSLAR